MKKIIIVFLVVIIIICSIFISFKYLNTDDKQNSKLTSITVAEVAHSIFYAPQYVALENGYFEEEGIDVNLVLTSGANNVMAAVLSGDAEIGFSGSEATIYVYNNGEKDYIMTFAGLTKRDGSFLVSRKKIDNFTLNDLKGKYVIGGRTAGMPEMTFEWALSQNGIDPKKDLTIDTSIDFASMEGAFVGGTGDFVTLFEPNATNIEKSGLGYVVAYIGELGGEVPYTAYNAKKSFIENNPKLIKSFTRAINRGLDYVSTHSSEEIAMIISKQFPDSSIEDLTTIVERYKVGDAWKKNISITNEEWNHIQEIMINANALDSMVSYKKLVYSKYFNDFD